MKMIYTPADIMRDVQLKFGISISYMKAYRSREAVLECIRGNSEESYMLLPSLFIYNTRNQPQLSCGSENY